MVWVDHLLLGRLCHWSITAICPRLFNIACLLDGFFFVNVAHDEQSGILWDIPPRGEQFGSERRKCLNMLEFITILDSPNLGGNWGNHHHAMSCHLPKKGVYGGHL